MTSLLIGEAEAAALAAGTPLVVVAPGMADALPVGVLRPVEGVLRMEGAAPGPARPFPAGLRPLALIAPDAAAAAALAGLLPAGTPSLVGAEPLPGLARLLAEALARSEASRAALQRRLARQPAPLPRRVVDLPPLPGATAPPPRLTQPLGRVAEGISGVALHLSAGATDPASLLRLRLMAGGRIVGAWTVPGAALRPGWLPLDLPEPAPPGVGDAMLEVALEAAAGDAVALSAGTADTGAPLALRVEVAEPGHLAAPLHFDWAARDMEVPAPGLALPIPEGAWDTVVVTGARAERVAAGAEPARLLLALVPGAEARLDLPPIACGPAELALADCRLRLGDAAGIEVALVAWPDGDEAAARHSLWRRFDSEAALRIALPLPRAAGGVIRLRLLVRPGGSAGTLEIERLALGMGMAGDPRRRPPEAVAAPARVAPQSTARVALPGAVDTGRIAVALPATVAPAPRAVAAPFLGGMAALGAGTAAFRVTPPQPKLTGGGAGAPVEVAPAAAFRFPDALSAAASFQDLKLQQHLVNTEGTYRHLDLTVTGLVAAAGLWRQVRLKLFERRGTVGLEFREMKGWPQMFDMWPGARRDDYGPFWRVESEAPAEALRQLATPHDRALILAVMDVLPALARRGALAANLAAAEQDAWTDRARSLATAVSATRL